MLIRILRWVVMRFFPAIARDIRSPSLEYWAINQPELDELEAHRQAWIQSLERLEQGKGEDKKDALL